MLIRRVSATAVRRLWRSVFGFREYSWTKFEFDWLRAKLALERANSERTELIHEGDQV